MKIIISIPTCSSERIPLLVKTVESIQAGSYKNVHPVIVADGNPHIQGVANKRLHHVSVISNKERMDWVYSTNRVLREFDAEYYIYAADDLIFPPDCIECAMATMRERFPDGFGVVTIGRKTRCCFALIGRKFVEHFPRRQVFCPDLIHYRSDSELLRVVKKLNKFAFAPKRDSQVVHSRLKDETWILAKGVRAKDFLVFQRREKKGYMWGIDFNLVTRRGND